ncbi:uncharacterized protein K441DRAFT_198540 [Cenococcum geophilum 1.58]|uniref:uncharacterized protein n=1 Tax=Cenococcum geophilum 1.58 TaxID=794803 RepID=UPI00358E47C6|nr:hypothetical protein K441DRAFT_198540 [Cenococcum geophilum 1.58]
MCFFFIGIKWVRFEKAAPNCAMTVWLIRVRSTFQQYLNHSEQRLLVSPRWEESDRIPGTKRSSSCTASSSFPDEKSKRGCNASMSKTFRHLIRLGCLSSQYRTYKTSPLRIARERNGSSHLRPSCCWQWCPAWSSILWSVLPHLFSARLAVCEMRLTISVVPKLPIDSLGFFQKRSSYR